MSERHQSSRRIHEAFFVKLFSHEFCLEIISYINTGWGIDRTCSAGNTVIHMGIVRLYHSDIRALEETTHKDTKDKLEDTRSIETQDCRRTS